MKYSLIDMSAEHAAEARMLATENYVEERAFTTSLPDVSAPEPGEMAKNGLGVAAFEGGRMVGFLCCSDPWENAFGTAARGTFTPAHAHGAISEGRRQIYMRLYQAAAEKWVARGIFYHCVSIYAHDSAAIDAFFTYGFGMRCVDAMRPLTPIPCAARDDAEFVRLADDARDAVFDMRLELSRHMGNSPCFMRSTQERARAHAISAGGRAADVFAALIDGKPVAFADGATSGETFASEAPGTRNITGAYCMPEHRGGDLYLNLLNFAMKYYEERGFGRLGVDYESFNPTANAFWGRHFAPYTRSLARRIDEAVK